ncbi:choline transporter-like 1 [Oppia nitens]|uniref:choline transporter-like 1 n=1 Tax=Oppia nitens TaxID=1686743 RepID=UPI0023DC6D6E|nr:choline transporter-like 1 [Oppia nitens]
MTINFLCCDCLSPQQVDINHISKPRKCTDLLCLAVFLLFWALLIFIAAFAFVIGSPSRLIHGSDSFGNTCGHLNSPMLDEPQLSGLDMTDKPYLYHLDQTNPQESLRICVRECPRRQLDNVADIYLFYRQTQSSLCRYDYNFTTTTAEPFDQQFARNDQAMARFSNTGPCPTSPVHSTRPILYRCVPELAVTQGQAFGHTVYEFISSYVPFKKVISDLVNSHKEMSIAVAVSVAAAFLSAFVIHFVAGIASWLILTLVSIALIALTVFMWYAYIDIRLHLNKLSVDKHLPFLQEDADNEQIVLWMAIITTGVSVILLLITCALRTRVRFVVALFKEAAHCIRSMPLILFQPVWTLLSLMIFMMFWLAVMLALATAEYARQEKRDLVALRISDRQMEPTTARLATFTLIDYRDASWIQYMWWYLIIAFIWTSEFILSCQQMVIAGAVSQWYFSRDRTQVHCPVGVAIRRLFLYHMGSIAKGSFLITMFKLPRLVLTYMHKKLQGYDNCVARGCLWTCNCILWLIERFIKYLNRNAYTVIAIEGLDFCASAQIAFNAIVTNALRVAAINSVGDFVLFLGKISVAAIAGLTGALLMKGNPMLHYWSVPTIVVAVVGFWIAHSILSVYEMIIDALFLCFCIDYNTNDGTPGKEYYAPASLMEFLTGEEVDNALKPMRSTIRSDL